VAHRTTVEYQHGAGVPAEPLPQRPAGPPPAPPTPPTTASLAQQFQTRPRTSQSTGD
jgi:hypothetical protein